MTLQKFQKLLTKIDPRLKLRMRGIADIAGLFIGTTGRQGYICRMTKGELHLDGYRLNFKNPDNMAEVKASVIVKRGRKTVINLLRNYRWVTKHKQRTMLTYGINYPDEEVRGLTNGTTSA